MSTEKNQRNIFTQFENISEQFKPSNLFLNLDELKFFLENTSGSLNKQELDYMCQMCEQDELYEWCVEIKKYSNII